MTDAAGLRALAKRVEAATGPDRALDFAIMRVAGWEEYVRHRGGLLAGIPCWRHPDGRIVEAPFHYTASLDAAASLVPEGLSWQSGRRCHSDDGWFGHSIVWEPSDPRDDEAMRFMASAATPALALCAAALRARAAMMEERE